MKLTPIVILLSASLIVMYGSGKCGSGEAAERQLIRAGKIFTMSGEPLEPGELLVNEAGRIVQIGTNIDQSADVKLVNLDSSVIIPGLINSYSQAGINGGTSEYTSEVTPDFNPLVAVDWRSRQFRELLAEGVTTVAVTPGTENVVAGQSAVIKTAGHHPDDRVVASQNGLVFTLASDPELRNRSRTRPDSIYVRQPTNRMGVVWIMRSTLFATLGGRPGGSAVLGQALAQSQRLYCIARTAYDIESLLEVSDEFGLSATIVGGQEAYKIADRLAERDFPVILGPFRTAMNTDREGTDAFWNRPGVLHEAGVVFALSGSNLLDQARFAVRFGLDPAIAMQSITRTPAELLGVADRVGTLAPGHDADLVILNGEPLAFTTRVQSVMIDGVIYDDEGTKK